MIKIAYASLFNLDPEYYRKIIFLPLNYFLKEAQKYRII